MTRQDLYAFFTRSGWTMKPNSTAYYKGSAPDLRYKVNKLVLRKERRLTDGTWHRVRSGYIAKLSISVNGKLDGMQT